MANTAVTPSSREQVFQVNLKPLPVVPIYILVPHEFIKCIEEGTQVMLHKHTPTQPFFISLDEINKANLEYNTQAKEWNPATQIL